MQDRQLEDLEVILSRFSIKDAFYLGRIKKTYFERTSALHHYSASGFSVLENPFGASFSITNWPFSTKTFDLIVLDNILLNANEIKQGLLEAVRVLSENGCLMILQYKEANVAKPPFRLINKEINAKGLHIIEDHYYDLFSLKDINSWLPCLLPESFSCEYIASFSQQVIPLSSLFLGGTKMVRMAGKYAIVMNNDL